MTFTKVLSLLALFQLSCVVATSESALERMVERAQHHAYLEVTPCSEITKGPKCVQAERCHWDRTTQTCSDKNSTSAPTSAPTSDLLQQCQYGYAAGKSLKVVMSDKNDGLNKDNAIMEYDKDVSTSCVNGKYCTECLGCMCYHEKSTQWCDRVAASNPNPAEADNYSSSCKNTIRGEDSTCFYENWECDNCDKRDDLGKCLTYKARSCGGKKYCHYD